MKSNARTNVPCAILAGGKSRRFGQDKAFAQYQGRYLIEVLVAALEAQSAAPIMITGHAQSVPVALDMDFVPDRLTGEIGPLGGVHSAMRWAHELGYESVVTTPVDTPLLPADFMVQLVAEGAPAIAKSADRLHPLHGLWSVHLGDELESRIRRGMRSGHAWAEACMAKHVDFPFQGELDPFFNVNTAADLDRLNKITESKPNSF